MKEELNKRLIGTGSYIETFSRFKTGFFKDIVNRDSIVTGRLHMDLSTEAFGKLAGQVLDSTCKRIFVRLAGKGDSGKIKSTSEERS